MICSFTFDFSDDRIDVGPPKSESISALIPPRPRPTLNRGPQGQHGPGTTFKIKPPHTFGLEPPQSPSANRPPIRIPPFSRPNAGPIQFKPSKPSTHEIVNGPIEGKKNLTDNKDNQTTIQTQLINNSNVNTSTTTTTMTPSSSVCIMRNNFNFNFNLLSF